jgi:hypothetical protein
VVVAVDGMAVAVEAVVVFSLALYLLPLVLRTLLL